MLNLSSILETLGQGAEEQIYFEYLNIVPKLRKYYQNPFVKQGSKTFKFFVGSDGKMMFKDHSASRSMFFGNCLNAAMFALNCDRKSALLDINERFMLGLTKDKNKVKLRSKPTEKYKPLEQPPPAEINYTLQQYRQYDIDYFKSFNINPALLPFYEVFSVRQVLIDNGIWNISSRHLPLFVFKQDGFIKCYSPHNTKMKKWYSNMPKETILDIDKLPEDKKVDKLIVSSSKKDGLIFATHGYWQVNLIGEGVKIDLSELKNKAKYVFLWLDCDKAGIQGMLNLCIKNPWIIPVFWSSEYKDISDFSRGNGFEQTRLLIKSYLGKPSMTWQMKNRN